MNFEVTLFERSTYLKGVRVFEDYHDLKKIHFLYNKLILWPGGRKCKLNGRFKNNSKKWVSFITLKKK
jgi:hypothetical protein